MGVRTRVRTGVRAKVRAEVRGYGGEDKGAGRGADAWAAHMEQQAPGCVWHSPLLTTPPFLTAALSQLHPLTLQRPFPNAALPRSGALQWPIPQSHPLTLQSSTPPTSQWPVPNAAHPRSGPFPITAPCFAVANPTPLLSSAQHPLPRGGRQPQRHLAQHLIAHSQQQAQHALIVPHAAHLRVCGECRCARAGGRCAGVPACRCAGGGCCRGGAGASASKGSGRCYFRR